MRFMVVAGVCALTSVAQGQPSSDRETFAQSLERGCSDGKPDDCGMLGRAYATGDSTTINVGKDAARAATLFEQGCRLGSGDACHGLGELYRDGDGVEQSNELAIQFFGESCDDKSTPGGFARDLSCLQAGHLLMKDFARYDEGLTRYKQACDRASLCVAYEAYTGTNRYQPQENEPTGAVTYAFNTKIAAAKAACKKQKGKWKKSGESYLCEHPWISALEREAAYVEISFCEKALCEITVAIEVPTKDVLTTYNDLQSRIWKLYKTPSRVDRILPSECDNVGVFNDCLKKKSAKFHSSWLWKTKTGIGLTVVDGADATSAVLLIYNSPADAKRVENDGL